MQNVTSIKLWDPICVRIYKQFMLNLANKQNAYKCAKKWFNI